MKTSRLLIKLKILFTTLFLVLPLLFFPEEIFLFMGFTAFNNIIFVRLLGIAYFALLLMYLFLAGLPDLSDHAWWFLYLSGAVSNAGALIVIAFFYSYIAALNIFGQTYFFVTVIFLLTFNINFILLIAKSNKNLPIENNTPPNTNKIVKLKADGRWHAPFADTKKWKTGIYKSEYKSVDQISEFEKHNGPELFIAQNGHCGILLYEENSGETELILNSGEAILIDGWHNGFQVDADAYFLVVEADGLNTIFLERKPK